MIAKPSPRASIDLIAKVLIKAAKEADTTNHNQIGSFRVYLIESNNLVYGARGFTFSPKCYLLRLRSFSSPTIPVLSSDANF